MKIYLVRHAQTDANKCGIMQGQTENTQINTEGIEEAQSLKMKLSNIKFDKCYTSPLIRTWSTAMILVGEKTQIIEDNRLIERYLGNFEGKHKGTYDVEKYWNYELNSNSEDVEPIQNIFKRCKEFLDDIINKHEDEETIIIVSHSAIIRCLHHIINKSNLTSKLINFKIENCYCEKLELDKKNM